ncbi:MAG: sugar phosphate isomerase/epimerase [Solirubrobacterales bacterium]|nr:sugar phosphate isomerase/epimerase [Solirubrobacterales bacterium]
MSADRLPEFPAVAGDLRLGIDQPSGSWPTAPRLKSYEAAGFAYVQVRMPPRIVLEDPAMLATHAVALRRVLELTGMRLVLHAPGDLMAGARAADATLRGALDYAAMARAELIVYHGRRVPPGASGATTRLAAETRSLRRLLKRAAAAGVRIAIENLAPLYPGMDLVSHDPLAVYRLVQELDSPFAGMCLDIGHANVVAGLRGLDVVELIAPVLDRVCLFHLHDNFGASTERSGSLEPLRLDLHLAPGAGNVPWRRLAPLLAAHGAPLQLEVRAPSRPEPGTLAVMLRELLGRGILAGA